VHSAVHGIEFRRLLIILLLLRSARQVQALRSVRLSETPGRIALSTISSSSFFPQDNSKWNPRLQTQTARTLELVRAINFRHRESMEDADPLIPPSAAECLSGKQPLCCRSEGQKGRRSRLHLLLPMLECPDSKNSCTGSASGMNL
jgi:hypothetical protein